MYASIVFCGGPTCIWGVPLHHISINIIKKANQKYGYSSKR